MISNEARRKLISMREVREPLEVVRSGMAISVIPGVYPTSELSEILVETMDSKATAIGPESCILDYGCGTGFLALQAAIRGACAVGSDISPRAIECSNINMRKLIPEAPVKFLLGRNFEPLVGQKLEFDVIYAGMPWDDAKPSDFLEAALCDEEFSMRNSLFDNAPKFLKKGGFIIFSSRDGHQEDYPSAYPSTYDYQCVADRVIRGVRHTAIKAIPRL